MNKYSLFNYDLLLSIILGFAAIIIPIVVGFVFLNLVNRKKIDIDWRLLPFLGISIIILILQNFVYMDIPVKHISNYLIYFLLLIFAYFLGRKKLKLHREYIIVLLLASSVWLVNGVGYLRETAKWYTGYGWQDEYNYMVTAEFLKEYKFSTDYSNINTPYLVNAISKKNDRIGQSIYHAFLSSIFNLSSEYTYGALSLIAPFLTFFAFLYIFSLLKLKKIISYIFSFLAGVVPATSVIHLENFLSQALGTPFLIVTIAYILFLDIKKISWRTIFVLGLLMAGTNTIYTEYTPFILLVLALKIIILAFHFRRHMYGIGILLTSFICAVLLNIHYFNATLLIFKRTNLKGILSHVYPFSHTLYGYSRLYFGDLDTTKNILFFSVTFFLLALGAVGLLLLFLKRKSIAILILFCLPLFSIMLNIVLTDYPYQTYKLLLSFVPLLVLGLGYIGELILNKNRSSAIFIFLIYCLIIISIPIYATLKLSNFSYLGGGRSIKAIINTTDHRKNYQKLMYLRNKDIYLDANHPYELARLAYFGRHNRLWFLNPIIGDLDTRQISSFNFTHLENMPKDVITVDGVISFPKSNSKKHVYASIDGGIEGIKGNLWTWLGKEMDMKIFSQKEQNINIILSAYRGPANKDKKRTLRITNLDTKEIKETTFIESNPNINFEFLALKGYNNFKLETVYPKKVEFIPETDRRTFMVSLGNMIIN